MKRNMMVFSDWRPEISIVIGTIALALGSCSVPVDKAKNTDRSPRTEPVNIILMIGDGMGVTQMSSGMYYGRGRSNFMRFPYVGLIETSSASDSITDSAAGAVAMASGEKTNNGAIGLDPAGNPLPVITTILADKRYKTGLITTSSITHATPACFYARTPDRDREELIATQLAGSGIDFFAGGGLKFFNQREDGLNYLDSLRRYYHLETENINPDASLPAGGRYGFLLAEDGLPNSVTGRGDFLKDAGLLALDFLDRNDSGFFLMIESAQIDWGGHYNDATYTISEVLDFDRTIGAVLDFAERDGNTLVIVTADHETGGFALTAGSRTGEDGRVRADYNRISPAFATTGHTATLVPVLAYGPGAELFSGVYANTELFYRMLEAAGHR